MNISIEPLTSITEAPMELLLEADPSPALVNDYLRDGQTLIARSGNEITGVIVLLEVDKFTLEIKNLAVKQEFQRKGVASALLSEVTSLARGKGYQVLRISTGNSSIGPLVVYQKNGFEMVSIIRDYFIHHYKDPIIENGIICKHLIVLERKLLP